MVAKRHVRSSGTPCAASKGILPIVFLWAVLALAGCGRALTPGTGDAGPRSAMVVTSSRMVASPTGGPTIPVPENLTDAMTLWAVPEREAEHPIACSGTMTKRWLPDGESSSVGRFVGSQKLGQARSRMMQNRMREFMPLIQAVLEQLELPPELALLPAVESVFEPQAVSPAGAAGLWQLMPATARRFGLRVGEGTDERFDVRKSTAAAAAYLRNLHGIFGNWPLALAAYNCGESALSRAMKLTGAKTLPDLIQACRRHDDEPTLLSRETLDYVPKFVAAVLALSRVEDAEAAVLMHREFRPMFADGAPVILTAFEGRVRCDKDSPTDNNFPD